MEEGNIKGHYLSNIIRLKLLILTKDVPVPSEFLLGNNSNDRIGAIEKVRKFCRYSKSLQRFPKNSDQNNGIRETDLR